MSDFDSEMDSFTREMELFDREMELLELGTPAACHAGDISLTASGEDAVLGETLAVQG